MVPQKKLEEFKSFALNNLTAYIGKGSARWVGFSENLVFIIVFRRFSLKAGIGESEYEAEFGDQAMVVGGFAPLSTKVLFPTTEEVIDFFDFKIEKNQILEFIT